MKSHNDGSFSDCVGCPANHNCCFRQRHSGFGRIEAPFLLPEEAEHIEAFTGMPRQDFWETVKNVNGIDTHGLRTIENHCQFYLNGRCAIYSVRPVDCRLFPFDIVEDQSGQHWWIVYTDLCPVDFKFERYFDTAKQTLAQSGWHESELHQYSSHKVDDMTKHPHRILEKVTLPNAE